MQNMPLDGGALPNIGDDFNKMFGPGMGEGFGLAKELITISKSLEENIIRANISPKRARALLLQYGRVLRNMVRRRELPPEQGGLLFINVQLAIQRGINGWSTNKSIQAITSGPHGAPDAPAKRSFFRR